MVSVNQPALRSARLRLEPLRDEHLPYEVTLDTDPAVTVFLGGPARDATHVSQAHQRRMQLAERQPGLGYWMAFCGDDFVGLMMLPPAHGPDQPDDPQVADLGYRLSPQAWGRGYGREAARLLLGHAFETVGMSRVIAQTRSDNRRSRALLGAVGLRHVRDFRSADDTTNGPLDSEYEMTALDWANSRKRLSAHLSSWSLTPHLL